MSTVTLLMAVHCHQPVGNFGFVFERAYAQSYDPFLGVLERHPGVRLALHYSGPLLDWLREHHPEFLARVRRLAAGGQAEILASGYYEPILPLLPEGDRLGQIAKMRRAVYRHFGAQAEGLWLTERVWEPELPQTLRAAGISYTLVDTNQFASAKGWLPGQLQVESGEFWDLLGSYTTDYSGKAVRLFPASKQLRYTMPFQAVDKTVDFLRRLRREQDVAITFADDGEKFGFWPKTYKWVYEEGWLDKFFSAVESEAAWLKTDTLQNYCRRNPPNGHLYLPCGSYEEMLEWSNGNFRNFFAKYPEADAMQQAMLRVSQDLREVTGRSPLLEQAREHLYAGQCNCAYWHGVFGGLYLSHLRRAVYTHLIQAEAAVNRLNKVAAACRLRDTDSDGNDEVQVVTAAQSLVIDPQENAAVTSWNLYGPAVNLVDTLSRRPESYHRKLRKSKESSVAVSAQGAPASIHELMEAKEERLAEHLFYDDHRRAAFHDYGLDRMPSLEEVVRGSWSERRLWSSGPYRLEKLRPTCGRQSLAVGLTRQMHQGTLRKQIRVDRAQAEGDFEYGLENVSAPVVALEFNLGLRDERFLSQPRQFDAVGRFQVDEDWSGVHLGLEIDPPARLYAFAIETVSGSEGGLERNYQGLCLVALWQRQDDRPWKGCIRWTSGKK